MKLLVIIVQTISLVFLRQGGKTYLVQKSGKHYLVEVARNGSLPKKYVRKKEKDLRGNKDFAHNLEYCKGMEAMCKGRVTCIEALDCQRWGSGQGINKGSIKKEFQDKVGSNITENAENSCKSDNFDKRKIKNAEYRREVLFLQFLTPQML